LRRYHLDGEESAPRRGDLRVYLGAAPGVGKTYAMLNEARRLKAAGHDVVVGFVESHGRAETEAQIGDLEVLPRLPISYRGVIVEEMDTDAILRRKPEIVLIDELAHSNVPGSPRAKRHEDVEIIRRAGIDVMSTLNIQHLESLQDVVASITGVEVRETIPDRILDGAEVQLVDLPTDLLIERLRQGKVYPPQRAAQALRNYFRPGNLTALREMALRRTAAGVDEALTDYMLEHGIEEIWPAAERVLVVVDGDPAAGTVLRNAWRLATALRGELVAAFVAPPGGLSSLRAAERIAVRKNLDLAEDLGARTREVEASDLAEGIASIVREEHATLIVLRYVRSEGWRRLRGESLIDRLLERLDNVDIYLVESDGTRR
jgi:two-component system sensor histidine kinase KdpD